MFLPTAVVYLPVGARDVHRRQAVGRAAEGFVQPLYVCQAHLGRVEQVNLEKKHETRNYSAHTNKVSVHSSIDSETRKLN